MVFPQITHLSELGNTKTVCLNLWLLPAPFNPVQSCTSLFTVSSLCVYDFFPSCYLNFVCVCVCSICLLAGQTWRTPVRSASLAPPQLNMPSTLTNSSCKFTTSRWDGCGKDEKKINRGVGKERKGLNKSCPFVLDSQLLLYRYCSCNTISFCFSPPVMDHVRLLSFFSLFSFVQGYFLLRFLANQVGGKRFMDFFRQFVKKYHGQLILSQVRPWCRKPIFPWVT